MGFYYNTILCYGFYTTDKSIKAKLEKEWYVEFAEGIIVFVPKTLYIVKAIDNVIDSTEVLQGYVSLSEVTRVFNIDSTYFNVTDEQNNLLIQLANDHGVDKNEVKIWIVESVSCTLERESFPYITKRLPVI